jgi:hypothetical protein
MNAVVVIYKYGIVVDPEFTSGGNPVVNVRFLMATGPAAAVSAVDP